MKRRDAMALLGCAAVTRPLAVVAQPSTLPVIGFLSGRSGHDAAWQVAAFRRGLGEAGYVDGRNASIEFRWAEGRYDRLPALAAELVRMPVAVLVATGGSRAVVVAKAATSSIPIVFTIGGDPVTLGVVASLGRPGGNATGISFLTFELTGKRLELLREAVPKAGVVAMIVNPNTPTWEAQVGGAQEVARSLGLSLRVFKAGTAGEIDAAFSSLQRLRPGALLVGTDAFLAGRHPQIIALAARQALPTIYESREAVDAGGLMSYGPDLAEAYAQAGAYTGRVLKGARPAELPVQQPTKFEFVVNARTAKALGLTVPPALLVRADEVIE